MTDYSHGSRLTPAGSSAFTFVEILAAMLFMAIVIPVTIQGISIANRAGVMSERSRRAVQLADQKLTEVVLTGEWRNGEQEGVFDEEWRNGNEPRYRWTLAAEAWEEDTMRLVIVKVYYIVQEREYDVTLCTIVEEEEEVEQ